MEDAFVPVIKFKFDGIEVSNLEIQVMKKESSQYQISHHTIIVAKMMNHDVAVIFKKKKQFVKLIFNSQYLHFVVNLY